VPRVLRWHLSRRVDDAFGLAGIPLREDFVPPCCGARRSRVEQYYVNVDVLKWADARRVLVVYNARAILFDTHRERTGPLVAARRLTRVAPGGGQCDYVPPLVHANRRPWADDVMR
jgi:hypothetical protein